MLLFLESFRGCFWQFLRHRETITCEVTDQRKRGKGTFQCYSTILFVLRTQSSSIKRHVPNTWWVRPSINHVLNKYYALNRELHLTTSAYGRLVVGRAVFFLVKLSCSELCFIFRPACCHSSCLTLLRPSCQTWRTCLCHLIPSIDRHEWACADYVTKCGHLIGRSPVTPTPAGLQNAEVVKLIFKLLALIMRQRFRFSCGLIWPQASSIKKKNSAKIGLDHLIYFSALH